MSQSAIESTKIPVILVSDIGRATEFYRDRLGYAVIKDTGAWVELQTADGVLALHGGGERAELPTRAAGRVGFSLKVADLAATVDDLRSRGVEFLMGPTRQDFGCSMAVFQDPDGVNWHLVQEDQA